MKFRIDFDGVEFGPFVSITEARIEAEKLLRPWMQGEDRVHYWGCRPLYAYVVTEYHMDTTYSLTILEVE